jgi:nucleoside-diphosphate-sugar epimerase
MKKVFILGATSPTGKVLLTHLQSIKNLDITCYVRSPEKLSSFKNLKLIKGDITDQPSLSKSMKEMDIIITLLSGETVKIQAENVIKSMKENNIKRIIWMTGMGIHHEVPGPIKEILDKLVESQPNYVAAANLVMNSGLEYTLLRGAHLTDGNNKKYYTQKEGEPLRCNTCDRIAISVFIGEIIDNFELYKNVSIGLTN